MFIPEKARQARQLINQQGSQDGQVLRVRAATTATLELRVVQSGSLPGVQPATLAAKALRPGASQWKMCTACGCLEPFQTVTEECCWVQSGGARQCISRTPTSKRQTGWSPSTGQPTCLASQARHQLSRKHLFHHQFSQLTASQLPQMPAARQPAARQPAARQPAARLPGSQLPSCQLLNIQ